MNSRYRSAVTGEFVSEQFAELHPRQTVKEEELEEKEEEAEEE